MVTNKSFNVAVIFISLITAYLIAITLQFPLIGLDVQKNKMGEWQITKIDPISWAKEQNIQPGDIVLSVNQKQAGEHSTIKKFGVLEQAEHIELMRNGQSFLYEVPKAPDSRQLIHYTFIPVFTLLLMIWFSNFLIKKKKEDTSVFILVLFFLSVGMGYISTGGSSRGDYLSRLINDVTFLSVPVFLLNFLQSYFSKFGIRMFHSKLLLYLWTINGTLVLIDCLLMITKLGSFYPIMRNSKLVVFSTVIILCIFVMLSAYIRYTYTVHKPVLSIMLIGMIFAFFPFVGLAALPQVFRGIELIPVSISAIFLFFVPVTFLYLVSTNRLLDIDFIINRLRYYSILAVFPGMLIATLIDVFDRGANPFLHWLLDFTIIHIIITLFLYVKEKLSFRLRSKLFTEKNNFQASLDQFSSELSKIMKVTDLEERLIAEIKNVLVVNLVSLIEVKEKECTLELKRGHPDFPTDLIKNFIADSSKEAISIGEIFDIGQGIFLYVGKKRNTSDVLWIGEKVNRTQYNLDEKVWLQTIAHYVSIVYENLYFIEELTDDLKELMEQKSRYAPPWFLRFMFHLSEKERFRLALDLHDSALQNQLFWYRKLESILRESELPPNLMLELNAVKEGLLDVIHEVRETCNELQPPLLKEMGIVAAIQQLLYQTQLRAGYEIEFDAEEFQDDLDYEQTIALYRIVQELLGNASKHSKASRVDITLASTYKKILLHYRDNGIGMDLGDLENNFKHIGLSGIKERVSSLEGETSFFSRRGNGMEVSIWIPRTTADAINDDQWRGDFHDSFIVN